MQKKNKNKKCFFCFSEQIIIIKCKQMRENERRERRESSTDQENKVNLCCFYFQFSSFSFGMWFGSI